MTISALTTFILYYLIIVALTYKFIRWVYDKDHEKNLRKLGETYDNFTLAQKAAVHKAYLERVRSCKPYWVLLGILWPLYWGVIIILLITRLPRIINKLKSR